VRERSELPPLPNGLSKDEMRKAIHRERRVELAFEEKRWYDLIRLRLAEKNLNSTLHAMVIENINGTWTYKVVPAPGGQRVFYPEKNYFLPIPQGALDQNTQLTQNPNY
ncbi:MAG: RagB/SusD family nutrient uptake outer membrane protein, partial [Spirosomataceae bacterium]